MRTNYPNWIRDREAALENAAQRARQEAEHRREAQALEDERFSRQSRREAKLEALRAAAATAPCPACGSPEKSMAMMTSTGLVARCRHCGLDWQEVAR